MEKVHASDEYFTATGNYTVHDFVSTQIQDINVHL